MGGFVGGDPSEMSGAARALHRTGEQVGDAGQELTRSTRTGAASAGYGDLETAIQRIGAAVGTAVDDTGTQTTIAAALADAAAEDVQRAGGG